MNKTVCVLSEVRDERTKQDIQWGRQTHHPHKWLAILIEEVGEAAKGSLGCGFGNYRDELIQVAAVAVAAIESFDKMKDE